DNVDLLEGILAHVRGEKLVIAAAIKRNSPRVAQSVCENFRAPFSPKKRIVRWNRVGDALVDVDSQDLPQQDAGILTIAVGAVPEADIVGLSAVANSDVQVT